MRVLTFQKPATDSRKVYELIDQLERDVSKSSAKRYTQSINNYIVWCESQNINVDVPFSEPILIRYIQHLQSVSEIKMFCAATKAAHFAGDLESSFTKPKIIRILKARLKQINRENPTVVRQAKGLTSDIMDRIEAKMPLNNPITTRDRALIRMGRDGLLRCDELVSLRWEDIEYLADGAATGLIRRSKTDQYGKGAVFYISPQTTEILNQYRENEDNTDGFVFHKQGNHYKEMSYVRANKIIKRWAKRIGENESEYSTHSMRVGMAQDLLSAGLSTTAISIAGRWSSDNMVIRYTRQLDVKKQAVAIYYEMKEEEQYDFND